MYQKKSTTALADGNRSGCSIAYRGPKDIKSRTGPGTLSTNSFNIDNWPDYGTDPACTAIWSGQTAERSFTITGATTDTHIRFLGGDYYLKGVGKGKNRIFTDNIKIEITT